MGSTGQHKTHMFSDQKPPQDVIDLVNQYKGAPTKFELIIHDNLFLLYELNIVSPEKEGEFTQVNLGSLVRRAYWRDAAGLSLEMMKSKLGIR